MRITCMILSLYLFLSNPSSLGVNALIEASGISFGALTRYLSLYRDYTRIWLLSEMCGGLIHARMLG